MKHKYNFMLTKFEIFIETKKLKKYYGSMSYPSQSFAIELRHIDFSYQDSSFGLLAHSR